MKLAMIGLGKMGANMARRLMKDGHAVVAFDLDLVIGLGVGPVDLDVITDHHAGEVQQCSGRHIHAAWGRRRRHAIDDPEDLVLAHAGWRRNILVGHRIANPFWSGATV